MGLQYIYIISFSVLLGAIYFAVEILTRLKFVDVEISRKIEHIFSGLTILMFPYLLSNEEMLILCALMIGGMIIARKTGLFRSVFSVERKSFGEILFPIAIALEILIILPVSVEAFQFGILTLSLADSGASIFGLKTKDNKYIFKKSQKTVAGTVAFFIIAYLLSLYYLNGIDLHIIKSLGLAGFLAFIEFVLIFGFDNLALPLFASLAYLLLI